MTSALRQSLLPAARRLVVKIGTQLVTRTDGDGTRLDLAYIRRIASQVARLRARGYELTLVSSGAVGAGCLELGMDTRPRDIADLQAIAAVGQRRLMAHMNQAFQRHGLKVGQMLLTRGDFDDRTRFLNIRNCVTRLHELGCVPILNENDTVAVDEIRFGDNDLLAAMMTTAIRADVLILLTNVAGLLDERGEVIDVVENARGHMGLARKERSTWGSGGMASKLEAARLVTEAGELAVIADGRQRDVLASVLAGKPIGTVFVPATRKLDARQRWIGLTARPAGALTVDDGAARALRQRGKSLLASGITKVRGRFGRGDVLVVRDARGNELARGLSNYAADELELIKGKRSNQFAAILGRGAFDEVIHRNNLVLLNNGDG